LNTFTRPRVTYGRVCNPVVDGRTMHDNRITNALLISGRCPVTADGTREILANMVIAAVVERHRRGVAAPSLGVEARKPDELSVPSDGALAWILRV
jgi:hypothetical protein